MLRLGFFPNFQNRDDTILIVVDDAHDAETLLARIRPLTGDATDIVELHEGLPQAPKRPVHLTARRGEVDDGICQRPSALGVPSFDWVRTAAGWDDVRQKLAALAAADGAGHFYLDNFAGTDDAVVLVAKGEYPNDWWRWQA